MKMNLRRALAGFTSGAIAVSALVVPSAVAQEATTTEMALPLACYVQPKGSASALRRSVNAGETGMDALSLSMKATAPETIEVGEEFDYVIDPETLTFPKYLKALGQTIDVTFMSQANLWIDLPKNAEVVSIDYDKNTPLGFNVIQDGNRIRFVGEERRTDTKQVGPIGHNGKPVGDNPAEWVPNRSFFDRSNETRWFYGGAEIKKTVGDGSKLGTPLPQVTLRMKATGAPGTTIQPSIRKTDATSNNPQAFAQGLVRGTVSGQVINALTRCGLSEDYTGSGSKLPATPFPAVTIVEKKETPTPTTTSEEQPAPVSPTTEESSAPVTSEEEKPTPTTTTSEKKGEESNTTSTTSEKDESSKAVEPTEKKDPESSKPAEPTEKKDEKPTTSTSEKMDGESSKAVEPTEKQDPESSKPAEPTAKQDEKPTTTTTEKKDPESSKPAEPTDKREGESSKAAEPTDKQDDKPTTTTTEKKDPESSKPAEPTDKREDESSKAAEPTDKQGDESSKPAEPTDKREDESSKAAEPTDKQDDKPTTNTTEQKDPESSKPAEPTEKKDEESSKPAEPTEKKDEESSTTTTTTTSEDSQSPTTTTTGEAPKDPAAPSDGSGNGSTDGSGKGSFEGSAKGFTDGSSELSSSPMGKIVLITLGVLAGLAGLVGIYNCFERNGYIQNCLDRLGSIKLPKF